MSYKHKNPIVLISGFKAGTWLMRKVLSSLTKMEFFEPEIIPGENKYYHVEQLQFVDSHFYSWHLVPTSEVVRKLNINNAKTIFVVRNIYDLVVSIYYHFYNDIDADIGRGNGKDRFLRQFSFEEGISLIITGFNENGLRWAGMGEVIKHQNEIFKASKECNSIVIDYDHMVNNKKYMIVKLAKYLNIEVSDRDIEIICHITSFSSMKNNAEINMLGGSHFRDGKPKANREKLSKTHEMQLKQMVRLVAPDIYINAKLANFETIVKRDAF